MLRSKPRFDYCGLSVVMSNPSRFDKHDLLTANGGQFFSEICLRPHFNRYQCDVRLKDDKSPLLPNTKVVLLLGQSAAQEWLNNTSNTLNEIRGCPYLINNIPHIASYLPQECVDFRNDEANLNPLSEGFQDDEFDSDDDDNSFVDNKRRHGKTRRRNFGFWLMKDVEKAKHILQHGIPKYSEPEFIIYPRPEEVIDLLTNTKNQWLDFDCETDSEFNITVFSFSFNNKQIYVVPCLLPNYTWAYSALPQIYRALAIAIRDNCLVAHNGSDFDFFVLAYKYRIPIGRNVYDTMLAQHRCFPEQEKSLGHATSLWTYEEFHKDEGDVPYSNTENAQRIWLYCGKDVYTMGLVREAINAYAKTQPGLQESIKQANESIRPYLITSLMGIRYNDKLVQSIVHENDRLMMQYLRMLRIAVGEENLKFIRGKGKSEMPGSNPQCVRYFHDMLGYPIVGKGQERKDGTRGPSLGKKNLFKLRLKHENPVIDLCLAYRETGKETGTLQFTPWIANETET